MNLKKIRRRSLYVFFLLAGSCGSLAAASDPLQIAAGVTGVVVHVGCGDGALSLALTDGDRRLVQGLCRPGELEAAKARILQTPGAAGVVTVRAAESFARLPYNSNVADLVVADCDALGSEAPSLGELERICAPGGIVLIREGGVWVPTVKARPTEVDDWPQQWGGPEGNPISEDELAAPATGYQWLAGHQLTSKHAMCIRGNLLASVRQPTRPNNIARPAGAAQTVIELRSAWNGAVKWQRPLAQSTFHDLHFPLLMDDQRIYTLQNNQLVAFDVATGDLSLQFPEAGTFQPALNNRSMQVVMDETTLLVSSGNKLLAYNKSDGSLRWSKTSPTYWALPRIGGGRVFALEANSPKGVGAADHGWVGVTGGSAVVAYDLTSGNPLWRYENPDRTGYGIANLVYHNGGDLYVQGFGRTVFRIATFISRVNPASGQPVWHWLDPDDQRVTTGPLRGMRTLAFDETGGYVLKSGRKFFHFHPDTQAILSTRDPKTWVACYGSILTPKFLFDAHVWYDREKEGEDDFLVAVHSQTRCTIPPVPANGLLYFREGLFCSCVTSARGVRAMTSENPGFEMPESSRLRTGPAYGRSVAPLESVAPAVNPNLWERDPTMTTRPEAVYDAQHRFLFPSGPLVMRDWLGNDAFQTAGSHVVQAGDLTLTVDIHRHTITATRGGLPVWKYLAGARISHAPMVHRGWVVLGTHDGWVTCLDASTGELAWQRNCAWNDRQGLFYGQFESLWPVYGAVANGGRVYSTAGRHPMLNHGIFVSCLDLTTGTPVWQRRGSLDLVWGRPVQESANRGALFVMNHCPTIIDDQLKLGSLRYELASGNFSDPYFTYTSGIVPSAFNGWISGFPSLPANRKTPEDDADNDSISNVVEFAFGSHPGTPDLAVLPSPSAVTMAGQTYGVISFRQRINGTGTPGVDYTANGVTYRVEVGNKPGEWLSGAERVEMVGTPVDNGDGTQTVRLRSREPLSSPGSTWFARVHLVFNN